jgi:ribosome assembly protein 1
MVPVRVAELTAADKVMLCRKREAKEGLEEGSFSFDLDDEVLMALCRVFSGTITKDSTLHVIGRKADGGGIIDNNSISGGAGGGNSSAGASSVSAASLGFYLCLGPSVSSIREVPAGNIAGIIGLEDVVLKTATMASLPSFPPLRPISFQAKPMLRVALEPEDHRDLPLLDKGLQLLYVVYSAFCCLPFFSCLMSLSLLSIHLLLPACIL